MLRLPGGGKELEFRGNAASSGWRQNVLKYVCVKLGYPAVAEEAAGSHRARIVAMRRRNGQGAKAGRKTDV